MSSRFSRRLKLATKNSDKFESGYYAGEAITKNQVLYISGVTGEWHTLSKAANTAVSSANGPLFLALHNLPSAAHGRCAQIGVVTDVDTSAATLGDPVYLSTGGGWTLTKPTSAIIRRIGRVTKVSATLGEWMFDGTNVQTPARPHGGNAVALIKEASAASATLAFTLANIGGNYDGKPAVACLMENDGTATSIKHVTWNGSGQATVTFNAATTGTPLVSLVVFPDGDTV